MTLFDKIWRDHLVSMDGDTGLVYIDRHLVHEVTSPQAFEGLRTAGRDMRRKDCTLVTCDHNVPTDDRGGVPVDVSEFIVEEASKLQVHLTNSVIRNSYSIIPFTNSRRLIPNILCPIFCSQYSVPNILFPNILFPILCSS